MRRLHLRQRLGSVLGPHPMLVDVRLVFLIQWFLPRPASRLCPDATLHLTSMHPNLLLRLALALCLITPLQLLAQMWPYTILTQVTLARYAAYSQT